MLILFWLPLSFLAMWNGCYLLPSESLVWKSKGLSGWKIFRNRKPSHTELESLWRCFTSCQYMQTPFIPGQLCLFHEHMLYSWSLPLMQKKKKNTPALVKKIKINTPYRPNANFPDDCFDLVCKMKDHELGVNQTWVLFSTPLLISLNLDFHIFKMKINIIYHLYCLKVLIK